MRVSTPLGNASDPGFRTCARNPAKSVGVHHRWSLAELRRRYRRFLVRSQDLTACPGPVSSGRPSGCLTRRACPLPRLEGVPPSVSCVSARCMRVSVATASRCRRISCAHRPNIPQRSAPLHARRHVDTRCRIMPHGAHLRLAGMTSRASRPRPTGFALECVVAYASRISQKGAKIWMSCA